MNNQGKATIAGISLAISTTRQEVILKSGCNFDLYGEF
jgi:hypothetical protein